MLARSMRWRYAESPTIRSAGTESEAAKTVVGEKVLLYDGVNLPFDGRLRPRSCTR